MPKSIKKRKIVKKTIDERVEVKGFISKFKGYAAENRKVFVAGTASVVAAVVLIAGLFVYSNYAKNKADRLEYEAYKAYYGLYQRQQVITKEEQYKKAKELFEKAYDARKTPASLFYIANCYYELGRYDDALETLKKLNQRFPNDVRFVPLLYYKMAMASMKKGNNDEALKFLDTLDKFNTGAHRDLSLIESGKLLEIMGRADEAMKKYDELVRNFPQSPFAEEARARISGKKS